MLEDCISIATIPQVVIDAIDVIIQLKNDIDESASLKSPAKIKDTI